jgi:hypothetical protein
MRTHPAVPAHHDEVRALVEELLRTGLMFTDVLSGLLDDMPDDAFPGENPAEVLIEMLTGSVRPVAEAVGAETVSAALALVGAMADRTVSDLRRALEIARGRRC